MAVGQGPNWGCNAEEKKIGPALTATHIVTEQAINKYINTRIRKNNFGGDARHKRAHAHARVP
jgi:hypothetical protein